VRPPNNVITVADEGVVVVVVNVEAEVVVRGGGATKGLGFSSNHHAVYSPLKF